MEEYHKIKSLYVRDEKTKKVNECIYRSDVFQYLANNDWIFTEKIDGTNIRIIWDGHKVTIAGRTDKAQIPAELTNRLMELFGGEANEQIFEQKFGEMEVMLVGEGYGAKIQGVGSKYLDHQDFILFDVKINGNWQPRESVEDIAKAFNLEAVPIVLEGTLQEAVNYIKTKPKSMVGDVIMEGVVGRPLVELLDRNGDRVIVKIKVCDFE